MKKFFANATFTFALLIAVSGCSALPGLGAGEIDRKELGENECADAREFPNEAIVAVVNDVRKGTVYVGLVNGDKQRLGTIRVDGKAHFYALGPIKGGSRALYIGLEPEGGGPAEMNKIYWHGLEGVYLRDGEVLFVRLKGRFSYDTTDPTTVRRPLDNTEFYKGVLPRYCK